MSLSPTRERLRKLIESRCITRGDFTLQSGKKSSYYIDARKLFSGECLLLLGEELSDAVDEVKFDAVGGMETGAIAPTAALLLNLRTKYEWMLSDVDSSKVPTDLPRIPDEGFYVRKAAKTHGTGSLIEGSIKGGDQVVIIDDVLTTGQSALKAIKAVEAVGAKVMRVVCVVDRLQGAREALAGYDFWPVFTVRDFGIEPDPKPLTVTRVAVMEAIIAFEVAAMGVPPHPNVLMVTDAGLAELKTWAGDDPKQVCGLTVKLVETPTGSGMFWVAYEQVS